MGLFNALNRLFVSSIFARAPVDVEETRRRKVFTAFTLSVLVPLVVFGTIHVVSRDRLYGLMIYCVVLVLVIALVIVRFLNYGKPVYRVAMAALMALMCYWLFVGTIGGYGSLWILVAAPFSFFLMGRKEGSVWTILMGLVAAAIFINPASLIPSFEYPVDYSVRHLSVYTLLFLLTYYYEAVRERYKTAMEEEQAKLVWEKELLERTRREVEQVNVLLKGEMEVRRSVEENLRKHRDNLELIVAERTAEIKKKNLELEEGERRYRLLADNANDMIWATDLDLAFTYISPSVTRMFGFSVEEAMRLTFDSWNTPESFRTVAQIYVDQMNLEQEGSADPNRHVTVQLEHYRKDGTPLDVEVTVSFLRDSDGRAAGIVGITRDISDRMRVQREKEQVQQQLAQAQKMEAIGTLVAGIAHDFNNFLGGIMGSLDLLGWILKKEKIENREAVENYLQIGMDGSRRSADLIRQLLAISRKHEITLTPIDINVSLGHVLELCRNSFPKTVTLDFRLGEAPLVVLADPLQIEQVLLNICINASHAMTTMRHPGGGQGGTLTVTADTVASGETRGEFFPGGVMPAGTYVLVRITDTGVGIAEDVRKRIFEPFFTTNKMKGSGLGLSTSYSIVQQHRGGIDVSTSPGEGSTFSIYLPAYAAADGGAPAPSADGDVVRGSGTVLVIDDEESIIRVVKGFLEQSGYTVLGGNGAKKGIEMFRKWHGEIAAVIVDFSMPEKSGLEVFGELLEIDPGVRAILASGMIDPETRALALGMGIQDTINKPFLARELSEKLKAVTG